MTLRSSRTLPGHAYASRQATAPSSEVNCSEGMLARKAVHEVLGEDADVALPVTQRRNAEPLVMATR